MTLRERRAFGREQVTPELREARRLQHPLLLHHREQMRRELRQQGMSAAECEQQIDLRLMLHTDPRIARLATPTMNLSEQEAARITQRTGGLL